MADEKELLKLGVEAAVSGAIEGSGFRDLVHQFLGPLATEVGTGLGYVGTVLRMKLALSMMQKAAKMLAEAGIDPRPVAPKLFLPLLEHASLEDDDCLQKRWAALLANAADARSSTTVSSSFPQILSQLTADEVKLLDRIYDKAMKDYGPLFRPLVTGLRLPSRDELYLLDYLQLKGIMIPPDAESDMGIELQGNFCATLDNLKRLELIAERNSSNAFMLGQMGMDQGSFNDAVKKYLETVPLTEFYLTDLGALFVRGCREPTPKGSSAGN